MPDDLFTEYVHVTRRRLVRLTEENRLAVAEAVGATVHFGQGPGGTPIVSTGGGHHLKLGQWVDENGTGYGGDGVTPTGYLLPEEAAERLRDVPSTEAGEADPVLLVILLGSVLAVLAGAGVAAFAMGLLG